jgi:glycosyltransferase involved in cell wall biosynthesis
LTETGVSVEISVIANGCTDATASVAREAMRGGAFERAKVAVHEIERAGKSNAWNEFVHAIVSPNVDFVFFLDGDIRIPDRDGLRTVLAALRESPTAVVAVDRSVKDLDLERPKRLTEWLIQRASGTANDTSKAIAGAFYCVRYSEIRSIWMPIGLPGEDGFLRAMLLTSSFSHDERLERHLFVPEVYHVFESLRDARSVIRHNVRLAIGTAINILLFYHLRERGSQGADLGAYIRARNEQDPGWVNGLVKQWLETHYFPLQPRFLARRLREPRNWRSPKAVVIATFGTVFDLVVFAKATRLMRRGVGAGFW